MTPWTLLGYIVCAGVASLFVMFWRSFQDSRRSASVIELEKIDARLKAIQEDMQKLNTSMLEVKDCIIDFADMMGLDWQDGEDVEGKNVAVETCGDPNCPNCQGEHRQAEVEALIEQHPQGHYYLAYACKERPVKLTPIVENLNVGAVKLAKATATPITFEEFAMNVSEAHQKAAQQLKGNRSFYRLEL